MKPKFANIFGWLGGSVLCLLILYLLPYDEGDLALTRLKQKVLSSAELSTVIAQNCHELRPLTPNKFEQKLLPLFTTRPAASENEPLVAGAPPQSTCTLRVAETHISQLGLISLWSFSIEIQGHGTPILRNYSLQFPKPLSLFPIAFFIMHLIFGLGFSFVGISLMLYLLSLNGMNLIQTVSTLSQILKNTLLSDLNFYGYLLFSLWFALHLSHPKNSKSKRMTSNRIEILFNRGFLGTLGLWNPHVFLFTQRLLYPGTQTLKRLSHLFEGQLLVITLSVFLIGIDSQSASKLLTSIQVPRYISIALLIFFAFSQIPRNSRPEILFWRVRGIPKLLSFIVIMECLSFIYSPLRNIPTLLRVSSALILAEVSQEWSFSSKTIGHHFKLCFGAIFISLIVLNFSAERGLLDLIIELCDPRKHPTSVIPFAVISGFLLGFLSGGFSASSFVFVSELVNHYPGGLVRAALFDGLVLGLILSPFSLFNLLPAFLFQISIEELVKERFNQVFIPFLIGFIIYLIGTLNLVGILQPVTFIFLCLCALTFKLKRINWDFDRFEPGEHSDPR